MSDSGVFGFAALIEETERLLVEELSLRPLAIPPDLTSATGFWKDAQVRIETRAYSGEVVRYARFAIMRGRSLEIGNLLCCPVPAHPLPILGADLVALGAMSCMIAADLSPTLPPGAERAAQLAILAARRMHHEPLPEGGVLPAWCADWFSPFALYTRIAQQQREAAAEAFRDFPRVFITLAHTSQPRPDLAGQLAARYEGYAAAHRNDDKGLNLLVKIFGRDWAARYLHEVLFPPLETYVW